MKSPLVLLVVVLAAFTLYTLGIVVSHGYTGFLELALSEPWGGQMFVDLVIALTLFLVWMLRDARQQGISPWVYVALLLTTGSIGALAYLVHRALRGSGAGAPATS